MAGSWTVFRKSFIAGRSRGSGRGLQARYCPQSAASALVAAISARLCCRCWSSGTSCCLRTCSTVSVCVWRRLLGGGVAAAAHLSEESFASLLDVYSASSSCRRCSACAATWRASSSCRCRSSSAALAAASASALSSFLVFGFSLPLGGMVLGVQKERSESPEGKRNP